jgi:hypothetical protein
VQDLGDTVLGHPPHASSALDQPRGLSVAYTALTTRPGARQADRSPTRLRRSRCKTHITAVRPLGFAVRDSRRLRFNTLSATVYHRSFACIGRYTPTTAAANHYPAVAAAIVRIIAESATALARHNAGGL